MTPIRNSSLAHNKKKSHNAAVIVTVPSAVLWVLLFSVRRPARLKQPKQRSSNSSRISVSSVIDRILAPRKRPRCPPRVPAMKSSKNSSGLWYDAGRFNRFKTSPKLPAKKVARIHQVCGTMLVPGPKDNPRCPPGYLRKKVA